MDERVRPPDFTWLPRKIEPILRRAPLTAYFVLAYTITWSFWLVAKVRFERADDPEHIEILNYVSGFGPALAGVLVTWVAGGKAGLADLYSRLIRWRVGVTWYLVAVLLPLAAPLAVVAWSAVRGDEPLALLMNDRDAAGQLMRTAVFRLVAVTGEEIGWRGFALPTLLERRSAWESSVILGLLWGLWHLPMHFRPDMPWFFTALWLGAFLISTCVWSILLTWIAKHTAFSVVTAVLFHWCYNVGALIANYLEGDAETLAWLPILRFLLHIAAAVIVLMVFGPRDLTRTRPAQKPTPSEPLVEPVPSLGAEAPPRD